LNFREHLIGGVVVSAVAVGIGCHYYNLNPKVALVALGFGVFSSLYPDIDIKSKSSRLVSLIIAGLVIYFGMNHHMDLAIIGSVMMVIPMFLQHRGFTHSHVCGILVSSAMMYGYSVFCAPEWAVGVVAYLGYVTHLLLDGLAFKRLV